MDRVTFLDSAGIERFYHAENWVRNTTLESETNSNLEGPVAIAAGEEKSEGLVPQAGGGGSRTCARSGGDAESWLMVGGLWGGSAWSLVNTPVHKVDFFFFLQKKY